MKTIHIFSLLLWLFVSCGCCKEKTPETLSKKWKPQEEFLSEHCYRCFAHEKALLKFENIKGVVKKLDNGFFIGSKYYVLVDKKTIPYFDSVEKLLQNTFDDNLMLFPLQTGYTDQDINKNTTISGTLYECRAETPLNILKHIFAFSNDSENY